MSTSTAVSPFQFDGRQLRAVNIEGEPWFVAKDVAEALGYADTAKAVKAHCKAYRPVGVGVSPTLDSQTNIIPERDLYRLVMRSKLPEAERFEEWVVGEVLPSIRKTGSYSVQQQAQRPSERDPAVALGFASLILQTLPNLGENSKQVVEIERKEALDRMHKLYMEGASEHKGGLAALYDGGMRFVEVKL